MNNRYRITLQARIFILVSILVILSVSVLSAFFLRTLRGRMYDQFRTESQYLVNNFAKDAVEPVLIEDVESLRKATNNAIKNKNVVYAYIYNKKGEQLEGYSKVSAIDGKIEISNLSAVKIIADFNGKTSVMDARVPVLYEGGEKIGYVRLGISLEEIKAEISQIMAKSVVFGIGFLSVGFIVTFVFSRSISNPIKNMIATISYIVRHNDITRIIRENVNIKELDKLKESFNEMLNQIQQRDLALTKANEQLEIRVKERTAELTGEIAERKQAEKKIDNSQKLLQRIINLLPIRVFWKDKNLRYLGCNEIFAKDAGKNTPEDLIGKDDFQMNWKELAELYRADDQRIITSGEPRPSLEEPQTTPNGNKIWLRTSKVPLTDLQGNTIGILGTYEDITERKQAEEDMKEINNELEQTVKKLEEANQEMKNFVYIASHDLREPLRKITAFGTMLAKSLAGKLCDDDAENLKFMTDGSNRMTKMIEGLLVYSRVSTKAHSVETVNLNDIVKQISELELSVLLEEKHTTLDIPQPLPDVDVDPVQIRQLMQNLIANGMKYQAKDNTPHITITSKPAADGMVRINITDNGIGIAPEFQQAIFIMFKRLHTRNEYEGTGIGLAVCKKIVERHGGQVGIESQPGKGSTFWFTLPSANKTEPAPLQETSGKI